jgi:hypothetical protein
MRHYCHVDDSDFALPWAFHDILLYIMIAELYTIERNVRFV